VAIEIMLDLSIGHLPLNEVNAIERNREHSPVTHDSEYGFLIAVLNTGMEAEVLRTLERESGIQMLYLRRILKVARSWGVHYVKFDADGDHMGVFRHFDW